MAFDIEFPPLSEAAKRWFPWAEHKHGMIRGQLNVDVEQAEAAIAAWNRERTALVDLLPELDRRTGAAGQGRTDTDTARYAAEIREKWAGRDPRAIPEYATADRMNPVVAVRFLMGGRQAAFRREHDTHMAMSRGTSRIRADVAEMSRLRHAITTALGGGDGAAAAEAGRDRGVGLDEVRRDRPRGRRARASGRGAPAAARLPERRGGRRGLH
ncbi:hypothetical protein ACFPZ0_13635 [Streptomonospora nanhaiensis]|uniref:hypothetical protein n=1 Tax=Streptomonospora nanhaiensis TaxID=1323731 RepID=UPI001C992AA3|nr:hypothetical protein [Streptomonospora nanhaiensis]MBX9391120.1 hypothetical protein [Streptomonospora nanhaiensis]